MRIERLVMRGIGAFHAEQEIDFAKLSASGLFLIDGPTGAGKSTVIDAIVFALYGGVAGSQSSESRIRSTRCAEDELSEVELTFSVNGRRHLVKRTAARLKTARTGNVRTISEAVAMHEILPTGEKTNAISQVHAANIYIADLLNMNQDAFRRLVVLPQGEFAELLLMSPKSRFDSLKRLIANPLYGRVRDELKARHDEALNLRKGAQAQLDAAVHQVVGALRDEAWPDDLQEVIESLPSTPVEERVECAKAILDSIDVILAEETGRRDDLLGRTSAALERREAAAAVSDGLSRLLDAQGRLAATRAHLLPQDTARAVDALRALALSLPETIGALRPVAHWESQASQRMQDRETREARLRALESTVQECEAEAAAIPDQLQQLDQTLTAARMIAAEVPTRAAAVEELRAVLARFGDRDEARRIESVCAERWQRLADALEIARSAHDADVRHAQSLVDRQLSQRAAALALALVSGHACPVCGSLDHPTPAVHDGDEPLVSDDDVKAARARSQASERSAGDAERARDEAKSEWETASALVHQLEGFIGERVESAVRTELEAAEARLAEASVAAASLDSLLEQRAAKARRQGDIAADIASAAEESTAITASLAAADQLDAQFRAQVEALLGSSLSAQDALADAETRRLRIIAVIEADDALSEVIRHLPEGAIEADPQTAVDDARVTRELHEALHADATAAGDRIARLSGVRGAAAARCDELARAREECGAVVSDTQDVITVAGVVLATSNVNQRNLPLEMYVVQQRFSAVLAAASVQLANMMNGRYTYALDTDSRNGGHTGLGIAIVDGVSGTRRDPGTLSGGERFCAALALALGLAEVVRGEAGGAPLETLFVDEGFGSLDMDTLNTVVEQMEKLRDAGRVVGVISHVTEMKRHFPERLEVIKGAHGTSTIRQQLT